MVSKDAARPLSCCIMLITVISVGLWGGSFKTLTPLESGLRINQVTAQLDESARPYTAGRYYLGVQYKFIVYPATLQTIEFLGAGVLQGFAQGGGSGQGGGVQISLEVSFQYRLMVGSLRQIYKKYELGYARFYETTARAVLPAQAAIYSIADFYKQRELIGKVMHTNLNKEVMNQFAVVEHFQLRGITVPANVDSINLSNQIAIEKRKRTVVQQAARAIRADIDRIGRTALADVKIVQDTANASARVIVEKAQADGIRILQTAQAQAYKRMKDELGYSGSELITHLFYEYIRDLDDDGVQLVVDVDQAMFQV